MGGGESESGGTGSKSNIDNEISPLDIPSDSVAAGSEGGEKVMTSGSPLTSIPNVFRPEVFPNLRELSLSFCQLSGELDPFPSLPLTTLEISMGLKTATALSPNVFQALRRLEWLALDHNSIQTLRWAYTLSLLHIHRYVCTYM